MSERENKIAELQRIIGVLEDQKKAKQKELDSFELDPEDYTEQYDSDLDELNEINIGSLTYSASYVLKNIDETAYRCGLNDYVDSLDKEEQKEYKELESELEQIEEELDDAQAEFEALENDNEEE